MIGLSLERTPTLATLNLTNGSGFGLIVAAIASTSGWLPAEWLVVISLALAVSFVPAAPLYAAGERIYSRLKQPLSALEARTLMAADRPVAFEQVDALVSGTRWSSETR